MSTHLLGIAAARFSKATAWAATSTGYPNTSMRASAGDMWRRDGPRDGREGSIADIGTNKRSATRRRTTRRSSTSSYPTQQSVWTPPHQLVTSKQRRIGPPTVDALVVWRPFTQLLGRRAPAFLLFLTNQDTAVTMHLSALQTEVGKVTDGGPQVSEIWLIEVRFFGAN